MTRVLHHRAVAEAMIGRPIESGEVVHHKNCCTGDNRPENLEVLSTKEHHEIHYGTDLGIGRLVPLGVNFECGCYSAVISFSPRRVETFACELHREAVA